MYIVLMSSCQAGPVASCLSLLLQIAGDCALDENWQLWRHAGGWGDREAFKLVNGSKKAGIGRLSSRSMGVRRLGKLRRFQAVQFAVRRLMRLTGLQASQ